MCKLCDKFPVYEFTNKRKLCKMCFVNWFNKKFLYINRRFSMMRKGDFISYENNGDFKGVVLEYLLKNFSDKIGIRIVKSKKIKSLKKALSETTSSEADKIVRSVIFGNISKLKEYPSEGNLIKPLYLFLDKEVELYAKIKGLKFKKSGIKKDKISLFIDEMEKTHPEIKHAVISSYLNFGN